MFSVLSQGGGDWNHPLCRALVLLKQSPWLLVTILDGSPLRHSIPAYYYDSADASEIVFTMPRHESLSIISFCMSVMSCWISLAAQSMQFRGLLLLVGQGNLKQIMSDIIWSLARKAWPAKRALRRATVEEMGDMSPYVSAFVLCSRQLMFWTLIRSRVFVPWSRSCTAFFMVHVSDPHKSVFSTQALKNASLVDLEMLDYQMCCSLWNALQAWPLHDMKSFLESAT